MAANSGWEEVIKATVWRHPTFGDLLKQPNGWQLVTPETSPFTPQTAYTPRYFFGTLENAQRMSAEFMREAAKLRVHPNDMPPQEIVDGWVKAMDMGHGKWLWRNPKYGDIYVNEKTGRVTDFRPKGDWAKTDFAMPDNWGNFKSFEEARKQIPPMMEETKKTGKAPWLEAAAAATAASKAKAQTVLDARKASETQQAAMAGQRVIIIPCSATKNDVSGPTAARDLYTGSNFQGNLRAAIAQVGENNVRIMSAKHGLLKLDDKIAPYDVKMGSKESLSQNQRRFVELGLQLSDLRGAQIETMLPQQYLKILKKAAALPSGVGVEIGVDHFAGSRGIGDQRSIAKQLIMSGEFPIPQMPKVQMAKTKPVVAPATPPAAAETASQYLARISAESTAAGKALTEHTTDLNEIAQGAEKYNPLGALVAARAAYDAGGFDKQVLKNVMDRLWEANLGIVKKLSDTPPNKFPRGFAGRLEMLENLVSERMRQNETQRAENEAKKSVQEVRPSWMTDQSPMSPEEARDSALRYVRYDNIYDDVPPELKSLIDRKREILRQYNPLEQELSGVWRKPKENWDRVAAELGLTPQLEKYKDLGEKLGYLESQIQYTRIGLSPPPAPKGMFDAPVSSMPAPAAAMAQQAVGENPILAAYKAAHPDVTGWVELGSVANPGATRLHPTTEVSGKYYPSFFTPAHEARYEYLQKKYPEINPWRNVDLDKYSAREGSEITELLHLEMLHGSAQDAGEGDAVHQNFDPITGMSHYIAQANHLVNKQANEGLTAKEHSDAVIATNMAPTYWAWLAGANPMPPFKQTNPVLDESFGYLDEIHKFIRSLNWYGGDKKDQQKYKDIQSRLAEIAQSGVFGGAAGFALAEGKLSKEKLQPVLENAATALRNVVHEAELLPGTKIPVPLEPYQQAANAAGQAVAASEAVAAAPEVIARQAAQRAITPGAGSVARALSPGWTPAEGLPAANIRGVLAPPTPDVFEQMLRSNIGPVEENMALIPKGARTAGQQAYRYLTGTRPGPRISPSANSALNDLLAQAEGGVAWKSPGRGALYNAVTGGEAAQRAEMARQIGLLNEPLAIPQTTGPSGGLARMGSQAVQGFGNTQPAVRNFVTGVREFGPQIEIGPTGNPGAAVRALNPGPAGGYGWTGSGSGGYPSYGGGAGGGGIGGGGGGIGGPLELGPGAGGGNTVTSGLNAASGAAKPGFWSFGEGLAYPINANPVTKLASRGWGAFPGALAEGGTLESLAGKGLLRGIGAGLVEGAPLIAAQIANKGMNYFTPKQYQNDAGYRFTQGALTGAAVGSIIPGANIITIPAGALIGGVGNTIKGWFEDKSNTDLRHSNEARYARIADLMDTAGLTQKQKAALQSRYNTQMALADGDQNKMQQYLDSLEQQVVGLAGTNPYQLTGADLIGLQGEIAKYMQPLQERMTASSSGLAAAYNNIANQMSNAQMADAARLQGSTVQANADAMNLAIARAATMAPMNYAYTLDKSTPASGTANLAAALGG